MPVITEAALEQRPLTTNSFGYSGTRLDDLGATEYTLVSVAADTSGSVAAFGRELTEALKRIVQSCRCSARADNLMMVSAARQGHYDKFIFRFSDNQHYDVRTIVDVPTAGINFVVLSTGICLHLTDDSVLEIFPNRRDAGGLRILTDPRLTADCRLLANGAQALFARGQTLCRFSAKKSPAPHRNPS